MKPAVSCQLSKLCLSCQHLVQTACCPTLVFSRPISPSNLFLWLSLTVYHSVAVSSCCFLVLVLLSVWSLQWLQSVKHHRVYIAANMFIVF